MIETGETAPDFAAPAVTETDAAVLELFSEIRRNDAVVLLFFPADFVPACTAELRAVREAGWSARAELSVIGLSADSLFSHAAYADRYDLPFPIVSDFQAGIAGSYGLVAEKWEGHSQIPQRATVVIDGDWEVHAVERESDATNEVNPAPVERATGTLRELGCPVERPTVEYARFG